MKTIAIVTSLSLCALFAAHAEKPAPKPECALDPAPKPECALEVISPVGANAKPQTEAIPKEHAGEKAVAIKLEGLKQVGERLAMQVTLRIINPTDKPVIFTGYSEASPITKTQHLKDGKWVDEKQLLRCGTGLRSCTIAPGQSAVFNAAVYGETMPTRFGIAYRTSEKQPKTQDVWSEKIER